MRAAAHLRELHERAQCSKRWCFTLDFHGALQQGSGVVHRRTVAPQFVSRLEVQLERLGVGNAPGAEARIFRGRELHLEGVDDGTGDTFLHVEDIVHCAAVLLGPQRCVGFGIDQLRRYAQRAARLANRTSKEIAHA